MGLGRGRGRTWTSMERSFSETKSVTEASYDPISLSSARKSSDLTNLGRLSRDMSM